MIKYSAYKGIDEEGINQAPLERQRLVKAVGEGFMFVASEPRGRKP